MPLRRILVVIGTRPEAIKLAPVVHALRRRAEQCAVRVCLTGQHRELLAPLVDYFELRPDVDLQLMTFDQTPASFVAHALAALGELLQVEQIDELIVQGDTSTVVAAALAAFYQRVPLTHVEAGLRTGNLAQPWPEEFNRRVATLAAARHAAPTPAAAEALLREGVEPARVRITGNTVIDALRWTQQREQDRQAFWQERYAWLHDEPLVLVTAHRRENLGAPLERIALAVRTLALTHPEVKFLWPCHPNPAIAVVLAKYLVGLDNVRVVEPVEYPEFVWLLDRSRLILSDSGGIQEEAPALGRSLLVLRDTTERPEALTTGWVTLVGTETERIVAAAEPHLQNHPLQIGASHETSTIFGDGHAAERIAEWVLSPTV